MNRNHFGMQQQRRDEERTKFSPHLILIHFAELSAGAWPWPGYVRALFLSFLLFWSMTWPEWPLQDRSGRQHKSLLSDGRTLILLSSSRKGREEGEERENSLIVQWFLIWWRNEASKPNPNLTEPSCGCCMQQWCWWRKKKLLLPPKVRPGWGRRKIIFKSFFLALSLCCRFLDEISFTWPADFLSFMWGLKATWRGAWVHGGIDGGEANKRKTSTIQRQRSVSFSYTHKWIFRWFFYS